MQPDTKFKKATKALKVRRKLIFCLLGSIEGQGSHPMESPQTPRLQMIGNTPSYIEPTKPFSSFNDLKSPYSPPAVLKGSENCIQDGDTAKESQICNSTEHYNNISLKSNETLAVNNANAEMPMDSTSSVSSDVLKDNEGFLPPPPASTLLIRRARSSSTGAPTYVVSSPGASTSQNAENDFNYSTINSHQKQGKTTKRPSGKGSHSHSSQVKRKPGRPVGSVGPYKRKKYYSESTSYPTGDSTGVRVSSRMSTSIFKHDISGVVLHSSQEDSPYVYPTAIRTSHLSSGKPSLNHGFRKPYSKEYKRIPNPFNIDPLTGKRRYTRRKKIGDERSREMLTIEDFSGESEGEEKKPKKIHLSDNGVWRPTDDFRLIINMEATSDLETVFNGVKFSCFFSFTDIEERWKKLMFNDKASLVSQNAISSLHPDVKAKIYYESLFSPEEEKLLASIPVSPDSNPDIKLFQIMLEENLHTFNKHRTPRSLMMHWLDMKDYSVVSNQNVKDYSPAEHFEDFEDIVCENDDDSDEEIEHDSIILELKTEERHLKRKLKSLDDEINAWQAITGQIIEDGMKNNTLPPLPSDFDGKTYALLRGKEVYYGMTSREIILGRNTKDCKVDADLTEEGSSSKVSRKQAIIKLKRLGRFVLINRGKRPIFVDKKVVPYRCATVLHDQSIIQIAQINLIFFINEALVARVIERDVSDEIYASFKDLENESSTALTKAPQTYSTYSRQYSLYSNSSYGIFHYSSSARNIISGYSNPGPSHAELSAASHTVNSTLIGEPDETCSTICQPPASYVTIQ